MHAQDFLTIEFSLRNLIEKKTSEYHDLSQNFPALSRGERRAVPRVECASSSQPRGLAAAGQSPRPELAQDLLDAAALLQPSSPRPSQPHSSPFFSLLSPPKHPLSPTVASHSITTLSLLKQRQAQIELIKNPKY